MKFWKNQNKKNATEEIQNNILELPQSSNIPKTFIDLLEKYSIQQVTLSFEKNLDKWTTDTIIELGKELVSLDKNKIFIQFLEQFFVSKEEAGTVIFALQILSNTKNEKIITNFHQKFLEIFSSKKIEAIFSIAVKKEHPDIEVISLMRGTCAIPFLWLWQKTIQNRQTKIRLETIKLLGDFEWQQSKIASLLVPLLEDKKSEICKAAAISLSKLGKYAVPSLIKTLVKKENVEDFRTRTLVTWSLGKIGADAINAIPYLISCLSDNNSKVVRNAKWAMENMGEDAREQIIESITSIRNKDQKIVLIELLSSLEPTDEIAKVLVTFLNKKGDNVVEASIRALGKMKAKGKIAIPKLKKFTKSTLPSLKLAAIFALSQIEDKNQDLHPVLFKLCTDESPIIRQEALELTVNIAKSASKTQKLLMQSLDDKDENVKKSAIESLSSLDDVDGEILKKLPSYLLEDNKNIRLAIMKTMLDLEMKDSSSIVNLISILQTNDDPEINEYALLNLGIIGEKSVAPLMKVLNKNTKLRKQIINTITEIGEPAVAKLLGLLKGKNANIRKSAIKILENIGEVAIPGLVSALKEDNFWIKKAATIALINIKENVTVHLRDMLKSDNKEWQESALAVLKEIHIDTIEYLRRSQE